MQISANGIALEVEDHGSPAGEPLVLIMGLGMQLVAWHTDLVALLVARGFRVIRFDNRDIGLSTKTAAPPPAIREIVVSTLFPRRARSEYLLSDMADDAAALMDHLGIESAHVVGASMGGMIAQWLAISHPQKVRSLTSIMSNTGDRKHGRTKRSLLRKLPKAIAKDPSQAVEKGVYGFSLTSGPPFDPQAVALMMQESFDRSYRPDGAGRQGLAIAASRDRTWDLGRVRVPALVIHGLVDPLVQPSGGIATARAIPGAKLVMYPDMGHDLPRPRWSDIVTEISENAHHA
jgi:pimeloyl-ACP methyl ester carboxylesterase